MKKPKKIFRAACDAPDLEAFVHELEDGALRQLVEWLGERAKGGIRSVALGVAEVEAMNRFLKPIR